MILQRISSIVGTESTCNSTTIGRVPSERTAFVMAKEVATIIVEQKSKKEDCKQALLAQVTEKTTIIMKEPLEQERKDVNDNDTISKVNRQIRDISTMKKRENEKNIIKLIKADDIEAVSPRSRPAVCVGASTISGICTNAIQKHLGSVTGADLNSVCVVSASALGGNGLSVVYTVNIQLCNVSALIEIISEAVTKGYTKAHMRNRGKNSLFTILHLPHLSSSIQYSLQCEIRCLPTAQSTI